MTSGTSASSPPKASIATIARSPAALQAVTAAPE